MIGNAHLDPVWLWTKLEGFGEVVSTMESAARRIEENSDVVFTCSSAAYYDFVKRHDKMLFERIKKHVKSGRWCIVGGWWIQPDDNLPSGEIFARHALYSQRFYRENFGIICQTGYCVDSFGHNANMPQLLKQGGMNSFVFMRPGPGENPDIERLFIWAAPDGSAVTAFRITNQGYNGDVSGDIDRLLADSDACGLELMCFYGIGNHGGGPTRKQIAEIMRAREAGKPVKFSSPNEYFRAVKETGVKLPRYKGDLQFHAIGCYSAVSSLKRAQRTAEAALVEAEKLMFLASELIGSYYDAAEIERAYKKVLFNTFHDILCGCSVKEGLDAALSNYHSAIAAAGALKEKAVIDIAKNINTMVDGVTLAGKTDWQIWEEADLGVPVVLYNANSFPLNKTVTVSRVFASCADETGRALQLQYADDKYINGVEGKATLFEASIPPLGYTTYWLYKDKKLSPVQKSPLLAEKYALENEYIRVRFNADNGAVSSITDKRTGYGYLCGDSFVPYLFEDKSDTWSHGIGSYDVRDKRGMAFDGIRLVESGPIRGRVRVKYRYNHSYMVVDYSLERLSEHISVGVKLNYSEKDTILRIPAYLSGDRFLHEIPYGFAEKAPDGKETAVNRWGALLNPNGAGVCLITDCKPSFCADDGSIQFIAARNTIYANHYGRLDSGAEYDYTDEGLQYFRFLICPFQSADPTRFCALADTMEDVNYLIDAYHGGVLNRSGSLIAVDKANITVSAVKKQEDGNGDIIRLYETAQKQTAVQIRFRNKNFGLSFRPGEIKTLRIQNGELSETDFLEYVDAGHIRHTI